jgi:acetyl-CoA carboxylase biotin carboxylase subunit
VDTGYGEGGEVTPYYDPLLAKVISHGQHRSQAIERLVAGLQSFQIVGVKTNIPALCRILLSEPFQTHDIHTGLTGEVMARPTP